MARIPELQEKYRSLEVSLPIRGEEAVNAGCLLAFQYDYPDNPAEVVIDTDEFTAVCPWTGLPDYGRLTITYTPNDKCIELKSLKYYLLEFRNKGIFYEAVTNQILDDLVAACRPRRMTVTGDFAVRGGIKTVVTARYEQQTA